MPEYGKEATRNIMLYDPKQIYKRIILWKKKRFKEKANTSLLLVKGKFD
jgi:hypothetical protein